jgi:hypothetical protein
MEPQPQPQPQIEFLQSTKIKLGLSDIHFRGVFATLTKREFYD